MKICNKCSLEQNLNSNNFRVCKYSNGNEYFKATCRNCERLNSNTYNSNHRVEKREYSKRYSKDHPEYKKDWRHLNKDKINNEYKEKCKIDIEFRFRKNCSRAINDMLKSNNTSKNNYSILDFLPYSIEELLQYLESKFEYWMKWENYGVYNKKAWNDLDCSTWVWNLDHIIPQSKLKYSSMNEENFQKCWALINLRPYSAKQNTIDGATRIRHI